MSLLRIKMLPAAILATMSFGAPATEPGVAPWLTRIGLTSSILSTANWGKG